MQVSKKDYLSLMKEVCRYYERDFPKTVLREIRPDPWWHAAEGMLQFAGLEALMYRITGNRGYAERSKFLLLYVLEKVNQTFKGELKGEEEYNVGFAATQPVLVAYSVIEESIGWKDGERKKIEQGVEDILHRLIVEIPETDAQNRAISRAVGALLAAKVFPKNPKAPLWREWGKNCAQNSFNHQTIEDAYNYNSFWFFCVIQAIELLDEGFDAYYLPYHRLYFNHFRDISSPLGFLPDYGDSSWCNNWFTTIPILEKAASIFKDGSYKKAAHRYFSYIRKYLPVFGFDSIPDELPQSSAGPGYPNLDDLDRSRGGSNSLLFFLAYAYLWTDDDIREEPITTHSTLVERKAILRSGWDREDSYLIIGLEEGGGHGHADGNSIISFCQGGSVLLHDGGYHLKDAIYHNRLLWKKGISEKKIDSLADFKPPNASAKVEYFEEFPQLHLLQTTLGPHQRTVIMCEGIMVILDHLHLRQKITAACLYHTQRVKEKATNYVRCGIEYILDHHHLQRWYLHNEHDLLIVFPRALRIDVDEETRCYTKEFRICQILNGESEKGISFTSVLYPIDKDRVSSEAISRVKIIEPLCKDKTYFPLAEGISLTGENLNLTLGINYLTTDNLITYGKIKSDANFVYLREDSGYVLLAGINGSKLFYEDREIFSSGKRKSRFELKIVGSETLV